MFPAQLKLQYSDCPYRAVDNDGGRFNVSKITTQGQGDKFLSILLDLLPAQMYMAGN
jgi:hypothetical protein